MSWWSPWLCRLTWWPNKLYQLCLPKGIKSEISPVSLCCKDRLCGYICHAVICIPQMANHSEISKGSAEYCMVIDQKKNELTFSEAKCLWVTALLHRHDCPGEKYLGACSCFEPNVRENTFCTSHVQAHGLQPQSGYWQLPGAGGNGGSGLRLLE